MPIKSVLIYLCMLSMLATAGCALTPLASNDQEAAGGEPAESLVRLPLPDPPHHKTTSPAAATIQLTAWEQPASVQLRTEEDLEGETARDNIQEELPPVSELTDAMSMAELAATAVANNPQIQSARAKARALGYQVPQVTSLTDPTLTTTSFLDAIETAGGRQEAILSLKQQFPWFGKLALRGQVASRAARAASAEALAIELTVIEQVKLAYYQHYFLDGAIRVNGALQPQLEDVIEIVRTKYTTNSKQTGLESVLEAEVELTKLKTQIVELEQAKKRILADLAEATHLPDGALLDVVPTLIPSKIPHDAELLVQLVESCQPELQARMFEISRDRAAVALACKNYQPDFTLGFNWYDIDSGGISPVSNGDDAYSIIAGINLPIYRDRLRAAVCQARANVSHSVHSYEATRDRIVSEVRSQHATAVEQDKVLKYLEDEILPKAEETLKLSIESYRQDRIDFEKLIDNYQALLRFRIEQFVE